MIHLDLWRDLQDLVDGMAVAWVVRHLYLWRERRQRHRSGYRRPRS
jgi:hypothetical protein